MAGESHMEETCAAEAVPNCMRQTGTIAVRVSIPVCSQSDSKAWRRQPNAACRQVSDPTLDLPNAIALRIEARESHMEETCAAEAVPNCMRQRGTIAVRVSIPVCSQSDSKAW